MNANKRKFEMIKTASRRIGQYIRVHWRTSFNIEEENARYVKELVVELGG